MKELEFHAHKVGATCGRCGLPFAHPEQAIPLGYQWYHHACALAICAEIRAGMAAHNEELARRHLDEL